MRGLFIFGLCAVYLVFGSVAGLAHVHEAAGHHEESRGLHVDHAHIDPSGESHADHHADQHTGHHGGHHHDEPLPDQDDGDLQIDGRHVEHHRGDAVYLSQSAVRVLPNCRVVPAVATIVPAIEAPVPIAASDGVRPGRPRDPPRKTPPRLRAPPA